MELLPALPPEAAQQIDNLLTKAIEHNVPVETLERLLVMRRELQAEYAKKQYDAAMVQFQSNCPIIKKTKVVTTKSGVIAYKYAPIESIIAQVRHLLNECGLSYAIETETHLHDESTVKATCTAKHVDGHFETSSFTVPLGERTQIMNASQVVAAALTFAKRYAFINAFGILTGDEDTDGAVPSVQQEPIKEESIHALDKLIVLSELSKEQLLKRYKVRDLSELTVAQGKRMQEQLQTYIDRTGKDDIPY